MRKIILTAVLLSLSSPVFAQSEANLEKAKIEFRAGMSQMTEELNQLRDMVCPKQEQTEQMLCKMQFLGAIAIASSIDFAQTNAEIYAKLGKASESKKATADVEQGFIKLKDQLEKFNRWK